MPYGYMLCILCGILSVRISPCLSAYIRYGNILMVAFVSSFVFMSGLTEFIRPIVNFAVQLLTDRAHACTAWTIVLRWTVPYDGGDPCTARDNSVAE